MLLGRDNFVLFSNLFPCFREHCIVFLGFNKTRASRYVQAYTYSVSFSYYFHFLLFVSTSNAKFCHKNFPLPIISHYHWTRNRQSVTDEFEILGLGLICGWHEDHITVVLESIQEINSVRFSTKFTRSRKVLCFVVGRCTCNTVHVHSEPPNQNI